MEFLVLKMGSTLPSLKSRRGDFEDWVIRGVPVLGICYGHQLLAYAHGGRVADNPLGREYGTVQVGMDGAAARDELLGGLPASIPVHEGHTQSVLSLPPGAVRLAANPWDQNQAFRLVDRAWGVQFHPEFDADIMREYIGHYSETLSSEGQDPLALRGTARDDPSGPAILRRFVELCRPRD